MLISLKDDNASTVVYKFDKSAAPLNITQVFGTYDKSVSWRPTIVTTYSSADISESKRDIWVCLFIYVSSFSADVIVLHRTKEPSLQCNSRLPIQSFLLATACVMMLQSLSQLQMETGTLLSLSRMKSYHHGQGTVLTWRFRKRYLLPGMLRLGMGDHCSSCSLGKSRLCMRWEMGMVRNLADFNGILLTMTTTLIAPSVSATYNSYEIVVCLISILPKLEAIE